MIISFTAVRPDYIIASVSVNVLPHLKQSYVQLFFLALFSSFFVASTAEERGQKESRSTW